MASLNKQITGLKGSGPTVSATSQAPGIINNPLPPGNRKHVSLSDLPQSPDTSFSGVGSAAEEELPELKNKLSREEGKCRELQEQLQTTEQLLHEKEAAHAEQVTYCTFNSLFIHPNGQQLLVNNMLYVLVLSYRNSRLSCVRRTFVSRNKFRNMKKSY